MEQLLILLLIGVFSLVKWVIDNVTNKEEPPPAKGRGTSPEPRMETDEERRLRRFMEALGLPADEVRPVPNFPRQTEEQPAHRRLKPERQGRQRTARQLKPAAHPVTEEVAAQLEAVLAKKNEPSLGEPLGGEPLFTNFDAAPALQTTRLNTPATSEREEQRSRFPELRTAAGLRKAFILKEILGTPKALQQNV